MPSSPPEWTVWAAVVAVVGALWTAMNTQAKARIADKDSTIEKLLGVIEKKDAVIERQQAIIQSFSSERAK